MELDWGTMRARCIQAPLSGDICGLEAKFLGLVIKAISPAVVMLCHHRWACSNEVICSFLVQAWSPPRSRISVARASTGQLLNAPVFISPFFGAHIFETVPIKGSQNGHYLCYSIPSSRFGNMVILVCLPNIVCLLAALQRWKKLSPIPQSE